MFFELNRVNGALISHIKGQLCGRISGGAKCRLWLLYVRQNKPGISLLVTKAMNMSSVISKWEIVRNGHGRDCYITPGRLGTLQAMAPKECTKRCNMGWWLRCGT